MPTPTVPLLLLLVSVTITTCSPTNNTLNVRAWQNFGLDFTTFPEAEFMADKTNSGITFSGGGSRSYTATLGYLRGLYDLGLLNSTRYISSVSGGSWAATAFTFQQMDGHDGDVRHFLGSITQPEEVNWFSLFEIERGCGRGFPVEQNLLVKCAQLLLKGEVQSNWYEAISDVFLEPAKIPKRTLYSWNNATVDDILKRNPGKFNRDDFVLPCKGRQPCDNRPFLIINTAMLGPQKDEPFSVSKRSFTMLEWTPLYVGVGKTLDVTYQPSNETITVGGYIEPIGFGGLNINHTLDDDATKPPSSWWPPFPWWPKPSHRPTHLQRGAVMNVGGDVGFLRRGARQVMRHGKADSFQPNAKPSLQPNAKPSLQPNANDAFEPCQTHLSDSQTEGCVTVEQPRSFYALANATGTSSWAPGSLFADTPVLDILNDFVGLAVDYKSTATKERFETEPPVQMLLADAGALENHGLISLLRRRVENIVVFVNSPVPLRPKVHFDPFSRVPLSVDIDSSVPAFFGINVHEEISEQLGSDFHRNQVFNIGDFPRVVDALQKAQASGKGVVATTPLMTVQNNWWGIPAGLRVNVTWVYLSRIFEWERRLREGIASNVIPSKGDKGDPTVLPSKGPFKSFPHFSTSQLELSAPQANLLSDLAGWIVLENAEIFRNALGPKTGNTVTEPDTP